MSSVIILLIFLILLVGGLGGYYYYKKKTGEKNKDPHLKVGDIVKLRNVKINLYLTGSRGNKNENVQTIEDCEGKPSCSLWKVESSTLDDGDLIKEGDVIKLRSLRSTSGYYLSGSRGEDSSEVKTQDSLGCYDCEEWVIEGIQQSAINFLSNDVIKLKNVRASNTKKSGFYLTGGRGPAQKLVQTVPDCPGSVSCELWQLEIQ